MMRKLSLLSSSFLVLACCVSGAAHASPVSDTFILFLGGTEIERLLVTEQEEGALGVFKSFKTLFNPGSAVQAANGIGIVLGGREEGSTKVSDTVEFIRDPNDDKVRLLSVFSDGDKVPPLVPDKGEVESFVLRNFLGNAMPANRLVVYSGVSVPVPEPETYAMMIGGLGLLGWAVRRRHHRAG